MPGRAHPHNFAIAALTSLLSSAVSSPLLISMLRSRQMAMPRAVAKLSTRLADFTIAAVYRTLHLVVAVTVPLALISAFIGGWLITTAWWNGLASFDTSIWLGYGVFWLAYGVGAHVVVGGFQNVTPFSLYRDKLSRCFDVIRQSKDYSSVRRARQRAVSPALASLRGIDTPELLICASANLTETGAAQRVPWPSRSPSRRPRSPCPPWTEPSSTRRPLTAPSTAGPRFPDR